MNLKSKLKKFIFGEEETNNSGEIFVTTPKLNFSASFDDEKSMRLAQQIIDDVIQSRYGGEK